KGIRTRSSCLHCTENGVAHMHKLPHLCEVGTNEGEVVPVIQTPEPQYPVFGLFIGQLRPECITGIGGVGHQSPVTNHGGDLANGPRLRVDRMYVVVACHPTTLRLCDQALTRTSGTDVRRDVQLMP